MPSEETYMSEFNQYHKPDKTSQIIYKDLESLIEKIDKCKNNPGELSTTKLSEHIPSGFSTSTILLFKDTENKHDEYRDKDCKRNFRQSLREHAMKIINFEKKKMKLLANEQLKTYKNPNICYICHKMF